MSETAVQAFAVFAELLAVVTALRDSPAVLHAQSGSG